MPSKYFETASRIFAELAREVPAELKSLPEAILEAWDSGGKVVSFGNGGSAADSLHLTTELVAKFDEEPIHQPAVSLSSSPSTLTATANDWSFDEVFSRQVRALGSGSDVYLGISTSGNSENVLAGLDAALDTGGEVYGLTGKTGGAMADRPIRLITVPATDTAHVQEAHAACLHWVCRQLDQELNSG